MHTSTGSADTGFAHSDIAHAPAISLFPLNADDHAEALQAVYRATPHYWQMYHLPSSPAGQAQRDLKAVAATPGRAMMGIARAIDAALGETGAAHGEGAEVESGGVEMVGVVDFRMHWPDENVAYVGMIMVAEPYHRQGIGRAAWRLLAPWLAQSANMQVARAGIEQFNPGGLQFLQKIGFRLTGDSSRMQSGKRLVRLLYMEHDLAANQA